MKKTKLSALISLNNDAVQVLPTDQMKKIYGGDGGSHPDGNDATGGPPDLNTDAVAGPLVLLKK